MSMATVAEIVTLIETIKAEQDEVAQQQSASDASSYWYRSATWQLRQLEAELAEAEALLAKAEGSA